MNRFSSSFVTSFAELLTISIIHFVWQAVVLALLLVVVLKLWNVRSAHNRYLFSVGVLLMMGLAPVVTAIWHQSVRPSPAPIESVAVGLAASDSNEVRSISLPQVALPSEQAPTATATVRVEVYVLIAWLIGVCVFSLRLALGFGIGLWIRAKVQPLSADLQQRVQVLGEKLAVSVERRVFECARVGQAVAMGFLRPVVLIPAAWVTQLSPQTIEAIIAHELAHIRRWDLHVNLVQRVIETLLFYHPAVWWLSERIRLEREMCCDEIAAELFDRTTYARSLESVATISHRNLLLATSIGGGRKMKLLNRIGYLLRITPADTTGNGWTFGLLAIVLPLAAIMAFTYSAAAKPPREKNSKAAGSKAVDAIIVARIQPKTVTLVEQYIAKISSHRHIQIRALTKGSIDEFLVKDGQRVKQGDVLFRVQPVMYQARLDAESAEAKVAQLEYNNAKQLFENKVTSVNELSLQEAKLAKAMAKLKLATAELETTIAKAPFDGIIDRLQRQKGSSVLEGDVVATLSDNSIVRVDFNVPEARYLEFVADGERKEDLQLHLTLANGKVFDQFGRISSIESDFNYEQGTIGFRADFPNPSGILRQGQSGTVSLRRQLKDAIVVPQNATFEIANKRYVYSVDKDDVAHLREITVQQELNDNFVVKSGLAADERIVIEGLRQIVDGGKVVGEGVSRK